MDFSSILKGPLHTLCWVIPVLLLGLLLRSPWFKGMIGEAWGTFAAWVRLPADNYHRIHNVTLPTPDGTMQIDHIFVSRFGIFVVETKNMKGWIFGGEHQAPEKGDGVIICLKRIITPSPFSFAPLRRWVGKIRLPQLGIIGLPLTARPPREAFVQHPGC